MYTLVHALRVVSRLQGDTLSDSRSEEEHRPHISEQAVPDISGKYATHSSISKCFCFLTYSCIFVLPSALPFVFLVLRVLSGAAPLPGVDTVAGRLQECEALSQVSGSVSVLPTSITKQLRSLYSHQLLCCSLLRNFYCLRLSKKPPQASC